jgi:hypothetical protein
MDHLPHTTTVTPQFHTGIGKHATGNQPWPRTKAPRRGQSRLIPAGLLDACPTPHQHDGTNRPNTHSTVQADNHQQQTHPPFWLFISSECQKILHVFLEFFPFTFVMHADTSPSWLSSQSVSNLLVYQGVPTSSTAAAILKLREPILRGCEHPHSHDDLSSESARTKHMYVYIRTNKILFYICDAVGRTGFGCRLTSGTSRHALPSARRCPQ